MASTAVSFEAYPVIMAASVSGETCLRRSSTWMPVMSGILRSRMAASNVAFSITRRADRPSGQTVTSCPRRGSSARISSWSDTSSSTNRTRRLLGGVANSVLRLGSGRLPCLAERQDTLAVVLRQRGGERHPHRERAALPRARARRPDLAPVLGDDVVADEQPQSGPLPGPAAGIERLEDVVQYVRGHPAPGVGEQQLGPRPGRLQGDRQ